ncbi:helix-turn-helix domain-containing protein [Rhodospira trueperi]|uniref:helix-turn-helix domain-containing protein n=1 Tax=Rhodospira trueperi TaxID=69960 RepID=UPI00115FBE4A|nr:hypothetical protein [Rhodospira trueperi]
MLQTKPLIRIPDAAAHLNLSQPTVSKALDTLGSLDIVHEVSGRKRDRVFVYERYLDILNEGTEPIPR